MLKNGDVEERGCWKVRAARFCVVSRPEVKYRAGAARRVVGSDAVQSTIQIKMRFSLRSISVGSHRTESVCSSRPLPSPTYSQPILISSCAVSLVLPINLDAEFSVRKLLVYCLID